VTRRLIAVLPAAALLVALASPDTPILARAVIVALTAVTLWDPAAGLLVTAGAAPLGAFVIALDGVADFRLTEIILLSFVATWLIRAPLAPHVRDRAPRSHVPGPRLPRYAWAAAWLFTVLLASLSVGLSRQLLTDADVLRRNLTAVALHYFGYADPTGISDAARMLEGFALVAAAMDLIRRRPSLARSLPVALALSAVVATAASVLLVFGIGPQQVVAREAAIGYRFAAHVLDVNAAGSHFAMVLCLALGLAVRARGGRRAAWAAAALLCAVGLWMTRSRSAEAAAGLVIPTAFLWATTRAWPRPKRAALIAGVLAVLLGYGLVRGWQIEHDPTYTAVGFRQQFVMSSFRVIGTHPYLGIGPGRYFRDSSNFLTPQLAWTYGFENAHNNFLQVTTEEGIIGFFVYAAFFVGALGLAFRGLARAPTDWRLLGATAGIVAFLGTCLTGHPLLVPEVAAAFFLQLALAASLGGSALLASADAAPGTPSWLARKTPVPLWPTVPVIGTLAFAVLPAWTLEKPLLPVHLEEVDGMYYGDEGTADGVPFHWTRKYASLFVPRTARVIELPLRAPQQRVSPDQIVVDITVGGRMISRAIVGTTWSRVVLTLPSPAPPLRFTRINLQVNHPYRVSDFTPGSSDQRVVGVQMGDYRILRVAWEFVPKPAGARDSP
jgi:O-antigen ligase